MFGLAQLSTHLGFSLFLCTGLVLDLHTTTVESNFPCLKKGNIHVGDNLKEKPEPLTSSRIGSSGLVLAFGWDGLLVLSKQQHVFRFKLQNDKYTLKMQTKW